MSSIYRVYLSSTKKDLDLERKAVEDALAGKCIVKQSYRASEDDLIDTCLDDVGECDMYIAIVGLRYGYCPDDAVKNPQNKSITELEYEQATAKKLSRYVFVKDEGDIKAPHTDSHNRENGAGDKVREFRSRVGSGKDLVPALFSTVDDLKWRVLEAFFAFKARREGERAIMHGRRLAGEIDRDIALVFAPGTDDIEFSAVSEVAARDNRYLPLEIRPDDPRYLLSLDAALRRSRCVCWVLTPASISRYRGQAQMLAEVLAGIRKRTGGCYVLLVGAVASDLDPAWRFDDTYEVGADLLCLQTAGALDDLYRRVRERSPALAQDRRVGVPWVAIALTAQEAGELASDPDTVMAGFKPPQELVWKAQFDRLRSAVSKPGQKWPDHFYGAARGDWKPFGRGGKSVGHLLENVVSGINADRQPGRRETRLLGDAALQLQYYDFDELMDDRYGSGDTVTGLKERGCIVLVDEFALLHPNIRSRAEGLLTTHRSALVSADPSDPSWCSVDELLDDFSFLRIGSLFERFDKIGDPRCELALNSPQRLARWLRMVLPELVNSVGTSESDPVLVEKMWTDPS